LRRSMLEGRILNRLRAGWWWISFNEFIYVYHAKPDDIQISSITCYTRRKTIKVYRGTDGDTKPIEKECERFGWPHYTTDGEQMFENTHFKTETEAWESILESVKAGVSLIGGSVRNAEEELDRLRKIAGTRTKEFEEAHNNYNNWKTHNH